MNLIYSSPNKYHNLFFEMNDLINSSSNEINLYELLEIDLNSSDKEIKKAWKKLALKYHPDKNNNISNDKFIKIKYAYDILSNKDLKKQYDEQLKFKSNIKFDLNFNSNIKNYIDNFISLISLTETEKIIKLIFKKKEIMNELFNVSFGYNNISNISNFNDFIKKLIDITITIDYDLKDVWLCNSKNIYCNRCTKDIFEELIYPIDFEQIYEGDGDEILINNVLYKGNLTVKINIINTLCYGENYYVFDDELYVLIDNKRIKNNRFELNFLDGNKYIFNILKLNKIKNKIGNVLFKKNFGFPKFILNNITEKNILNFNKSIKDNEINITYSNLFFIILL